ncbi:hypothetical protein DYB26_010688 [Aphanomyces astaci]|uniref:Uncharacterized protein n=1 Tax=Aphanomyces astaci TaxID=112090 RepID=A0A397EIB1_APHAT|nr:hypothetical protein DYB38_011491 [Aphanomyces astaci]RHY92338.1 hypothetical protein DYB31_011175 [Aphanomyces astaci]RHZ06528.1 hypothetical protein DYB26_010688 [Aphanomyces astaci]
MKYHVSQVPASLPMLLQTPGGGGDMDLTELVTHCNQVETATSVKGLRGAYTVLLYDCKRIRLRPAEAAALPAGSPPLSPLMLYTHTPLDLELTELLADNR